MKTDLLHFVQLLIMSLYIFTVLLTQQQLFRCGKNVAAIKKYETISLQHPEGTVFLNSNLSTMSLSDPGIKLK